MTIRIDYCSTNKNQILVYNCMYAWHIYSNRIHFLTNLLISSWSGRIRSLPLPTYVCTKGFPQNFKPDLESDPRCDDMTNPCWHNTTIPSGKWFTRQLDRVLDSMTDIMVMYSNLLESQLGIGTRRNEKQCIRDRWWCDDAPEILGVVRGVLVGLLGAVMHLGVVMWWCIWEWWCGDAPGSGGVWCTAKWCNTSQ